MAIKITNNVLTRPNTPGGLSDGTENVTRQFGNQTEQFSRAPSTPDGWGGVANRYAGAEDRATAQAVQQVTASVNDTVRYIENLKTADEDSRQQSMFLRIEQQSHELRKTLRADPNLVNQSEDVQQAAYEIQRDMMIDAETTKEQYSRPEIKSLVKKNSQAFKANDSLDYTTRVLAPQMVNARKQRDTQDIGNIVGVAMSAQTPEATSKASNLISERYRTPEAYATYGAVGAQALEQGAMDQLKMGLIDAQTRQVDDVLADAPARLGLKGLVTKDAITEGPLAMLIAEQTAKLEANLLVAGASEGDRLLARENFQKTAQQAARAAINTHNEAFKAAEKERKELQQSAITSTGDSLFILASSGKATDSVINKRVNQTLRELGIDPIAAVEGRLEDPEQVKLYHGVIGQVARVNSEQRRVVRENARDAREIEQLRLAREAAIMPSTQKGSDLSFKDFGASSGLGDKSPLAYTADDWNQFNAFMRRTSPTHLPSKVEQAITYGLNSNDSSVVKQGMIAYENLEKNAPGLASQVDTRTREIAVRLKEGQDPKSVKAAVDQAALRTPEQKAAVNEIARKTQEEWKRDQVHPVAKAMGVKDLPPNILALANREYTDAIARGESPKVAQQTMLAKVEASTAKTTLMSVDGSSTLSVNAPEARFNVGKEKGTGWFSRLLGAPKNPNEVTTDALKEDIKDTLKQLGLPDEQRYFLGQPIERNGTPFYPILLLGEDGQHTGPAMDSSGSPVLWTFDAKNNPEMNRRREVVTARQSEAAAADEKKAIEIEHKTLLDEARRTGTAPLGAREFKDFEYRMYQQARKTITGK